ncbi:MAG: nitroreductase family protein [Spirochaetaceae bacterium]|nr:nitroreductase family protein [Spirochaetaceae bacterium]
MDILEEIRSRSTVKSFDRGTIDAEAINRILEAGRLSPSAKNRQAWRFIAVRREEVKQSLSDACYGDSRIIDAGCVIVACTTNIQYTMPNGQLSYPLDMAFAVSFMMLQAEHEGLGTAILATYDERAVKDLLTVPHAMRVVLLLAVGNSSEKTEYKDRLSKDRVISFDHW